MAVRLFALSLCLFVAAPMWAETFYINSRKIDFPIDIKPEKKALIQYILIFQSRDKGESWHQVAKLAPSQDAFPFDAPIDGESWFRVASVNLQGIQDPPDIYKTQNSWAVIVDTVPPRVSLNAFKQGSEVVATWKVDEEHPAWDKCRLEYQMKDQPGSPFMPISAKPEMNGQARWTPSAEGNLIIKMTMKDKADNVKVAFAEVGGSSAPVALASNTPPANHSLPNPLQIQPTPMDASVPPVPNLAPPTLPPSVDMAPQVPVVPVTTVDPTPPVQQPFRQADNHQMMPPSRVDMVPPPVRQLSMDHMPGYTSNKPMNSQPVTRTLTPDPRMLPLSTQAWSGTRQEIRPEVRQEPLRTIASSEYTPQPVVQVQHAPPPPPVNAKKLPPLIFVNTPEVVLEYEVSQIGPSGVGKVQIFCSVTDGNEWIEYLDDPSVIGQTSAGVHKRKVPLTAGDGDYWFIMNIKSKAQLRQEEERGVKGREPQREDAPEMRVRLDTKTPVAELYAPRPDPSRPNTLLLLWAAQDENLGDTPVTLEWSETREGPWNSIGLHMPNTGKHSWAIPDSLPVQVYLRLRVRDLAENESVAITQEPLIVDLKEAKGRLKSIQPLPRTGGR